MNVIVSSYIPSFMYHQNPILGFETKYQNLHTFSYKM